MSYVIVALVFTVIGFGLGWFFKSKVIRWAEDKKANFKNKVKGL